MFLSFQTGYMTVDRITTTPLIETAWFPKPFVGVSTAGTQRLTYIDRERVELSEIGLGSPPSILLRFHIPFFLCWSVEAHVPEHPP